MEEQKKILKNYSDGVQRLDSLLEGLSEDQLNLVRQEGKWSIRQIVHHIADAEEIWGLAIKTALGNTGCTFDLSWYKDNNLCAEPLDYAHRPIATALESFRLNRRMVVEMMEYFPDSFEKHIYLTKDTMPEPKRFDLAGILGFQEVHLKMHLDQIRETRKVHGIWQE